MIRRVGFTVARSPSESWAGRDVFRSLNGTGRTIKVMSDVSYTKAVRRADKTLASKSSVESKKT